VTLFAMFPQGYLFFQPEAKELVSRHKLYSTDTGKQEMIAIDLISSMTQRLCMETRPAWVFFEVLDTFRMFTSTYSECPTWTTRYPTETTYHCNNEINPNTLYYQTQSVNVGIDLRQIIVINYKTNKCVEPLYLVKCS
jgi:hypothetical protein